MENDYVTWSTLLKVASALIAANAVPFAWVWKTMAGSCSRDELNEAMKSRDERDKQFRQDIKELFALQAKDREDSNKKFWEVQSNINAVQVNVLGRLKNDGRP